MNYLSLIIQDMLDCGMNSKALSCMHLTRLKILESSVI